MAITAGGIWQIETNILQGYYTYSDNNTTVWITVPVTSTNRLQGNWFNNGESSGVWEGN